MGGDGCLKEREWQERVEGTKEDRDGILGVEGKKRVGMSVKEKGVKEG